MKRLSDEQNDSHIDAVLAVIMGVCFAMWLIGWWI